MFYAVRIDDQGREMLGTDNQAIIHLKTVKGAINRIRNNAWPCGSWLLRRGGNIHNLQPTPICKFTKHKNYLGSSPISESSGTVYAKGITEIVV